MLDIALMKQTVKAGAIAGSLFFSNFAPAQTKAVSQVNLSPHEVSAVSQRSGLNAVMAATERQSNAPLTQDENPVGGMGAAGAIRRFRFENGTLNIVYLGDSITQGVSLPDPDTQSPPATCTAFLRTHLGGASIHFANMGRNGHTTADFLPAAKTDFPQAEEAARRLQAIDKGAVLFSIMLGTNDSATRGPLGSPVSSSQYAANLKAIIAQLLYEFPHSVVIIHHPTWYSPNTENSADYGKAGLERLHEYSPAINTVVKFFASSSPGQVYEGDSDAFHFFAQNYASKLTPESGKQGAFYLHPNIAGAKALGELWANAILRVLSPTNVK